MTKILIISDVPDKGYWDFYEDGKLEDFDLIMSCGDLPSVYLQFIVTFAKCPVIYVRGNHDDHYDNQPPDGCLCIEDTIYVHDGIRILGLGGSYRYKPGKNQYTEREMSRRIRKMRYKLWRNRGFDILLTHNAIGGFDDDEDLPHRGFECFKGLLEKYSPKYMIHGHVHLNYGRKHKRITSYKNTTVINGYKSYILEYDN